jgi:hypothetical protein
MHIRVAEALQSVKPRWPKARTLKRDFKDIPNMKLNRRHRLVLTDSAARRSGPRLRHGALERSRQRAQ